MNWVALPRHQFSDELYPLPVGWTVAKAEEIYVKLDTGPLYDEKTCSVTGKVPVINQAENGFHGYHNFAPGVKASPTRPVVTFANHTCEMRWVTYPFSLIQNVFPLVGKVDICDTRYFYYASKGRVRLEEYKGHFPDFRRMWLPVPPLTEQRAIADILGSLDDKIELNHRMNETLEAMARTVFKSWFVDFDPVHAKSKGRQPEGMDAETARLFPSSFEDSEIGRVPKGWRVVPLRATCESIFSGGTPSTVKPAYWGGGLPWLSSGETRNSFIVMTEKTITEAGVANSSTRLARTGCSVIASAGQGHTRGQTSFLTFDSYINQSVVALIADKQVSSDYYLFYDLERRYEQFRQLSDSHSSRGSLTTKLLAGIQTVAPPRQLIEYFDVWVSSIGTRIITNIRQSNTLATLRDALLPRLLSGEIAVPASRVA